MGNRGNVTEMDSETILKMINQRMDDIYDVTDSLAKSYKVLNDAHGSLELTVTNRLTTLETEWRDVKTLAKYIFGTSILGFVLSLLSILKMFGVL